jgi:putative transposase
VVLNPLRAGMIKEIGDWPWSSYPAMIGAAHTPVWLQTDWLLGQFDPQHDRARGEICGFCARWSRVDKDLRNQVFLGSEGGCCAYASRSFPQTIAR